MREACVLAGRDGIRMHALVSFLAFSRTCARSFIDQAGPSFVGFQRNLSQAAAGQFDLLRYFEIKIRLCLPLVEIKALEIKMST